MGTQHQFYTLQGQYTVTDGDSFGSIFHPVSGIIQPEMLEPILPHLPKTEINYTDEPSYGTVPRSDSQRVHNLLARFSREAQDFYQKHRAVLDDIYDDHADETHRLHMSNDEVFRRVLGRAESTLSPPERFAVHSALFGHIGIKPVRMLRDAEAVYIFRSARAVRRFQNVVNWARLYQEAAARASQGVKRKDPAPNNPLYSFIEKARRLILKSRTMRKPTTMGTLGPSLDPPETGIVEVVGEQFNQNDQMILELLIAHYAEIPQIKHDTLASVAALIVRAIGAYPKLDLGVEAGYMALQELGVITPWTNFRLSTWMLGLPNIGYGADLITDELYRNCLEPAYQARLNELPDTMADLRRDWGDLPVFCVDSKMTTEVDDGISIETVPDSPDLRWVHVHVADPTAFITPKEMIAKYARRTLATTYTGEHHVKMLPGDAPARFSLAPNRPAMTISALCSTDGSLKDCRITPSIVRNVLRLTPLQLQQELSVPDVQEDLFTVGRPVSKVAIPDDDSWKKHLGDIYALKDVLASQLRRKRNHPDFLPARRGFYSTNYIAVNVENAGQRKVDLSHSRHWRGDPTISLKLSKSAVSKEYWEYTPEEFVSKDLVSEVMQLAGEAAALWCRQRKIPIVYNATKEVTGWPIRRLQHLLRSASSTSTQATNWPAGSYSATPAFHHNLGVEQYTRATSPLRRYSDLICHWQINAYLRNQADENRSDIEPSATEVLPFTKRDIEDYLIQTVGKEFRLRKLSQHDNYHWKMHALFRAFYFKEAELPDPLAVRVFDIQKSRSPNVDALIIGIISPFDTKCMFEPSEEGWELEAQPKDVIPAKIISVNPNYAGLLNVVAIGPPKRPGDLWGHDSAASLFKDAKRETAAL